ncbi:MAG: acyltransferase [Parvularculaceae bacterium]
MQRIVAVQYLRALAAMLVVIFHYANALRGEHALDVTTFRVGRWGVDIFFVISGFIMWTIAEARPRSPGGFMRDRILRIAPMYWVATLVAAFVSTRGGLSLGLTVEWERLVRSLFFIPQWNPVNGTVSPVLTVGWTLIIEMSFYALFTLALLFNKAWRLPLLTGSISLVALSSLFAQGATHPAAELFARSMFFEFNLGILLAIAWRSGWFDRLGERPRWLLGAGLVALAFPLAFFLNERTGIRLLDFGVAAFLLCAGGLALEPLARRRPIRPLLFLGAASYSIYLVHLMAMGPIEKIWPYAAVTGLPYVSLAAQCALAAGFGCLAYLAVEKPASRLLHRRFPGRFPGRPMGKIPDRGGSDSLMTESGEPE